MKGSVAKKNVIIGFTSQIIILLLGIVYPRVILNNYGSDANGLISTITQIFSYMSLLEAGIRQAAKNELFRYTAHGDKEGISVIASTARRYFHKITVVYGIGVLFVSCISPFLIKSNLDNKIIFFAVLFEGMAGVLTFYFVQTPSAILSAFGKEYINTTVEVANKGVSYLVRMGLAMLGTSLFFLQFSYFIITIAKVLFYKIYFRKQYNWINLHVGTGKEKLKDRNAYVVNELAWTVFSSTDNIILSVFVSTQAASVYTIYNMVFNALNTLLSSIYSSVNYMLGQAYHESLKKYEMLHDNFTSVFLGGMTVFVSIAYILILPFVRLYTEGVSDINYIYPSLPIFFCMIRILSWSRYITGNLTGLAGYAKPTSVISIIEAIINIVVSIILVQKFGILGVLIGSTVALPLKVIYCAYISDKKVLKRSHRSTVTVYTLNYFFFAIVVMASHFFNTDINSPIEFITWGIILTIIIGALGIIVNSIANPKCLKWIINSLKKRP